MTEITNKDVKKIARLARIEINEKDCEFLSKKLAEIIHWVEDLNELDTKDIEPMINVHHASLTLAKDEIKDGNISEDVLKNAKNSKYGYFAVPKVIE